MMRTTLLTSLVSLGPLVFLATQPATAQEPEPTTPCTCPLWPIYQMPDGAYIYYSEYHPEGPCFTGNYPVYLEGLYSGWPFSCPDCVGAGGPSEPGKKTVHRRIMRSKFRNFSPQPIEDDWSGIPQHLQGGTEVTRLTDGIDKLIVKIEDFDGVDDLFLAPFRARVRPREVSRAGASRVFFVAWETETPQANPAGFSVKTLSPAVVDSLNDANSIWRLKFERPNANRDKTIPVLALTEPKTAQLSVPATLTVNEAQSHAIVTVRRPWIGGQSDENADSKTSLKWHTVAGTATPDTEFANRPFAERELLEFGDEEQEKQIRIELTDDDVPGGDPGEAERETFKIVLTAPNPTGTMFPGGVPRFEIEVTIQDDES